MYRPGHSIIETTFHLQCIYIIIIEKTANNLWHCAVYRSPPTRSVIVPNMAFDPNFMQNLDGQIVFDAVVSISDI